MENIKNLDPQEVDQILRLPNSFYDKGYKKGKEDGERRAALRFAKRLLEEPVDLDLINQYTGLSKEKCKKLK
ncbi:hypothetical protein [Heyndrickxia coagulans]|uniref:hypothetical protein n=1 Tax=Heyndrickxia coagulans TaxID=1398 RepID=UPI0003F7A4A5|nr:hypothetical protein [Heyndrickxia coagulans]